VNIAREIIKCIEDGGKLLICGNGGSATMADHMAGELVGTFHGDNPLPAISLTNPAIFTALANDLDYRHIFDKQVVAYGIPEDILIIFSTSYNGNMPQARSLNLRYAHTAAQTIGMKVIIFPQDGDCTEDVQDNQQKLMHQVCREVKEYFG